MRAWTRPTRSLTVVATAIALLTSILGVPAAQSVIELPASVVDVQFPNSIESYPVVDYGKPSSSKDTRSGKATWRVVRGSGNCCENYVAASPEGRLYDFGGTYVNYTDDLGKTWQSVRPLAPLVTGEGTIVLAPNGDVLGVGWDPYSGDHLQSFKFDAEDKEWVYSEIPIHTPFFDREWVAVVPGPVTIGPLTGEYVVFLKGAWPSKEVWFYSVDGVSYLPASSKMVDQMTGSADTRWLKPVKDPAADWYQPNTNSNITPLGKGVAVAAPDFPAVVDQWSIFDPNGFSWAAHEFPSGDQLHGRLLADSRGRLHRLAPSGDNFTYSVSTNGGKSWKSTKVDLPKDHAIEEIDFKAHGALGIAAVAIHGHHGPSETDVDLVYKLDISSNQPHLSRFYRVGLGDLNVSAGVGADMRFDFESVAILPNGAVAVSFVDSLSGTTGVAPAVAIELGVKLNK